ncbi:MetQ/NlpA family ABC transporter substrate-binding protein [Lutispora sp.]|uniref:MetQ/NlpA family ABC transporter substrate-binding protein n=1 Tax=Lutispora sp. TaxID=2828727 RepID=UPI000EDC00AC|nr:MetQ/NlpA family ABC transporter substrate-binding protein [Lutispora sp.]MEA4963571.1 MetQ/NlpA family ABC transporter substrate-binding protein [Lutispora sp.]HCJ57607.1 methionine ABC transporter substrate-binding protein [Clostridiaceae bacterium]
MKKIISLVLALLLLASLTIGCAPKEEAAPAAAENEKETVLKVGATPIPHAEILEVVKPLLEKKGLKLEVIVFNDYVQPNTALADKELDANFFQHQPYLDNFNKERGLNLVSAAKVHVEPLGLYSKKINSITELKDGSTIAIPDDATNNARSLLLLQENGIIKLKDGGSISSSENDVVENPRNLKFQAIEAAQLPRVLEDVDAAIINTNFAIPANLNPVKDALLIEDGNSPYANTLVIRGGDEGREDLKELSNALNSPEVKKFIEEKYEGAIIAAY